MLISVHIPKTAGTAFGEVLERRFGAKLLRDYEDRPLSHGPPMRLAMALLQMPLATGRLAGFEAVHGHFLPLKYLAARGDVVAWLRDPAQRIVSRYEHYRRDVAAGRPLQRVAGLRPGLSLHEFLEIPRFRNTYAKYFRGFPLARVRSFGFSEDMGEGLGRIQRVVGLDLGLPRVANAHRDRIDAPYDMEPGVARRIEQLNRDDYRIWYRAREREGV